MTNSHPPKQPTIELQCRCPPHLPITHYELTKNHLETTKRKKTLQSEASLVTAFLYNPKLSNSLILQMISPWLQKNLFHYGHLVNPVSSVLLPFDELRTKHELPHSAFFDYLQSRHYARITPSLQFSKPSPFKRLILSGPTQKYIKLLNSYDMVFQGKKIHAQMEGTPRRGIIP